MSKEYLIFARKLFVFLLVIVLVDISLGKILEHFYLKIEVPTPEQHTTYSINQADSDILVFGSSRAQHHYDPEPFKALVDHSFYNTGKDGQGIFYSWAVLKSVLNRNDKPRILILDININEFNKDQDSYDRLSELLPYYKGNEEIQDIVNLKSPFEEIKAFSYLYRYNSKVLTIIKDNLFPRQDPMEKGFEPIQASEKNLELRDFYVQEELDSLEINAFRGFLEDAKKYNQKVFVFVSPTYRRYYKGTPESIKIAQEICSKLEVPFFSFHQDSLFLKNPNYFSDPSHLNEVGAEIYSDKIFEEIKRTRTL